ncbi:MAG: beta-mannosidase, partial [Lachnospiraceae bacterium]|nr:beta-mannosidase [Lachnospiraceae bacterium]
MRKRISKIALLSLVFLLSGCGKVNQADSGANSDDETKIADSSLEISDSAAEREEVVLKTYSWNDAAVYEAENGTLLGETMVSKSGDIGFVDGFVNETDGLEVTISIEETGFYDLSIVSKSGGSYKENLVWVDDEQLGSVVTESEDYADSVLSRVYMESGEHVVKIMKSWGWIQVDAIKVKPADELDPRRFDIEPVLVNPNASDNAKRLMTYLCDVYGTDIISGQFCDTGMVGHENATIWKTTDGKYPAILGLDMIEYTPSRVAHGS